MRLLRSLVVLVAAGVLAGCGADAAVPQTPPVSPVRPLPPDAVTITPSPSADGQCGDPTASFAPSSGAFAPESTMARIVAKGRLTVGVDQNTYLFGFRDPGTGQLQGFDIDLAREIARDLFGDPNRIELRSVSTAERVPALTNHEVDLVVRTFSVTCDRLHDIAFSSVYFTAPQRILAARNSGIHGAADLDGKRVCVTVGADSADRLFALHLPHPPTVLGVTNWTDCLVALQQGQVDAVSTDEPILAGLAAQDSNLQVVGDPLGYEYYAVGVPKGEDDMVRFVNGVLNRIRTDGTWQRLYNQSLTALGPSPGPPAPHYSG
jgi:polar amino acid transport system substrate-binding protein